MTDTRTADTRPGGEAAAEKSPRARADTARTSWPGGIIEWKTGPVKEFVDDFAGDGCRCGCGES